MQPTGSSTFNLENNLFVAYSSVFVVVEMGPKSSIEQLVFANSLSKETKKIKKIKIQDKARIPVL